GGLSAAGGLTATGGLTALGGLSEAGGLVTVAEAGGLVTAAFGGDSGAGLVVVDVGVTDEVSLVSQSML
ncbi:MAG: hypothetical protein ACRDS0_21945, partial [Pseudonocardiaceae bacterium]